MNGVNANYGSLVRLGLLLAGICTVAATMARAELPPQPNDGASLVVEGVVREAFRSARTTTFDDVFLIEVRSARLGSKPQRPYGGPLPKPGVGIYVHAFQRTPDAPQIPGPGGYRALPAEGSVIVAYLYPHNGSSWQFAYPLGFVEQGRVASDDLSPLTPLPARVAPLPAAPVAVAPVAVVPVPVAPLSPRRLGIQAVPVVIKDERGLKLTLVLPGSVAARAGLVTGDVILKAGPAATGEVSALTDQIVNGGPRLSLLVRRAVGGKREAVEVDFAPAR